jgi:IPT/TIG domain
VTKLTPNKGPAAGGTSVTVTGTGFTGATAVDFGSTSATGFEVTSPTSLTAIAPPGSVGTVDLTVTTPNGTSALTRKDHFKYRKS